MNIKTTALATILSAGGTASIAAGVSINGTGITFPDNSVQTTAAYNTSTCIPIKQADIPLTISAPGSYCLHENLIPAAGVTPISITTSNVLLNLNGFSVDGSANTLSDSAFGVLCNSASNITVSNGDIHNFMIGISFNSCPNSHLSQLRIHHTYNKGIYLDSSANSRVMYNTVHHIGGVAWTIYGIHSENGNGMRFIGNDIDSLTSTSNKSCYGIRSNHPSASPAPSGAQVIGNRISNLVTDTGIQRPIYLSKGNNIIRGNSISGLNVTGVAINGTSGNTSNTAVCADNLAIGYTSSITNCVDGGGNYP